MTAYLEEHDERHTWRLEDHTITALIIGPDGLRLQAWRMSGHVEARINVPFRFVDSDCVSVQLDPEDARALAPLLALVNASLTEILVESSGRITLAFGTGPRIDVDPHPDFEAWELEIEGQMGGRAYLCMPGGGQPWG